MGGKIRGVAAPARRRVLPALGQSADPSRPLHLLVGFGAGTSMDNVARIVGDKLSASLGQPLVVENREGNFGDTANELVAKAAPEVTRSASSARP